MNLVWVYVTCLQIKLSTKNIFFLRKKRRKYIRHLRVCTARYHSLATYNLVSNSIAQVTKPVMLQDPYTRNGVGSLSITFRIFTYRWSLAQLFLDLFGKSRVKESSWRQRSYTNYINHPMSFFLLTYSSLPNVNSRVLGFMQSPVKKFNFRMKRHFHPNTS